MTSQAKPVVVQILDKDYRVACTPEEEAALITSARFLDQRMREIRSSGKVIGADRIAVMAALNIAHELLQQRSDREDRDEQLGERIRRLRDHIDGALNDTNQLEL